MSNYKCGFKALSFVKGTTVGWFTHSVHLEMRETSKRQMEDRKLKNEREM